MNTKPILTTSNLHKTYRMDGTHDVHVLKGIDLSIRAGEIVTILGPSGVGKSTLLHVIGTLDRPTQGKCYLDNEDVFAYNDIKLAWIRNQNVGFVFQFHHLLPEFSALENVMMPGLIAGKNRKELQEQALHLLDDVGLTQRAEHRPNELSGGEQQRIAVARALINTPRLVLADEPSGNLDVHTAESLHRVLWTVSRKYGQTLVIVTHNQSLAERSDRIIELYDGQIQRNINNRNS